MRKACYNVYDIAWWLLTFLVKLYIIRERQKNLNVRWSHSNIRNLKKIFNLPSHVQWEVQYLLQYFCEFFTSSSELLLFNSCASPSLAPLFSQTITSSIQTVTDTVFVFIVVKKVVPTEMELTFSPRAFVDVLLMTWLNAGVAIWHPCSLNFSG